MATVLSPDIRGEVERTIPRLRAQLVDLEQYRGEAHPYARAELDAQIAGTRDDIAKAEALLAEAPPQQNALRRIAASSTVERRPAPASFGENDAPAFGAGDGPAFGASDAPAFGAGDLPAFPDGAPASVSPAGRAGAAGDPSDPAAPPFDPDEPGRTRLGTAVSQFGRGAMVAAAGLPKSLGIAQAQGNRAMLETFDRLDRGEDEEIGGFPAAGLADIQRYREAPPEERDALRRKYSVTDPRETGAFKAGEAITEATEKALPVNKEQAEEFLAGKVPQGLGSAFGFLVTGLAGRAIGMGAALPAAGAGAALGGASQFEDALQKGASLEDAFRAADLGAAVGTTEAVPIVRLLDRLDKGTGGSVRTLVRNAIKQGTEEAAQEAFQTIMANLIAADLVAYDPERKLFEGTGEAAGVGFTVGAIMQTIGGLIFPGRRGGAQPAQDAQEPQPATPPTPRPETGTGDADMAAEQPAFGQDDAPAFPEGAVPAETVIGREAEPEAPAVAPEAPAVAEEITPEPKETAAQGPVEVTEEIGVEPAAETQAEPARPVEPQAEAETIPAADPQALHARLAKPILDSVLALTPDAIAKAHGIEAREATALLQEMAKRGEIRAVSSTKAYDNLVKRRGQIEASTSIEPAVKKRALATLDRQIADIGSRVRYRRPPKRGPLTLSQFVASRGGIADESGELRAMDLGNRTMIPGFGPLVRTRGQNLDMAREAAAEAGYLPEGSTVADFLDAIRRDTSTKETAGKVFSHADTTEVGERIEAGRAERDAARERDAREEIEAAAKQVGMEVTEQDATASLARVMSGEDALDVLADIWERRALQSESDVRDEIEDAARREGEEAAPTGERSPAERREEARAAATGEPGRAARRDDEEAGREEGRRVSPTTESTPQGEQAVMPGMERSARQAQQAREAEGRGRMHSRVEQKDADEGLFAERPDDEPGMFQKIDATDNPARAPVTDDFPIDATGDVVAGDTIRFEEAVFGGSFRKPSFIGNRTVEAEVVRDSYGADKQQHTFTLRVLRSEGAEALKPGTETRRKGRNVYRNGTKRQRWTDEDARRGAADEKHARGDAARMERAARKEETPRFQRTEGRPETETIGREGGLQVRLSFTPEFDRKREAVYADLRKELSRLGLRDIRLRVPDAIEGIVGGRETGDRFGGHYLARLIDVSLQSPDARGTLRHEAIHAMRDLGLFDDAEWATLERAAQADWMRRYRIAEKYNGLTEEQQIEEAVAEAFGAWRRGDIRSGGKVKTAFAKIVQIVKAMARAFRKNAFRTADEVFERTESGEVGARPRAGEGRQEGRMHRTRRDAEATARQQERRTGFVYEVYEQRGDQGPVWIASGGRVHARDMLRAGMPVEDLPTELQAWVREQGETPPPAPTRPSHAREAAPMREAAEQMSLFQRLDPDVADSAENRKTAAQGFIARGQPIDRALRLPFDWFGGVNEKGEWQPGLKLFDKAETAIKTASFPDRFVWANGVLENARRGLIDRYGLDPEYVKRERRIDLDKREIAGRGASAIKSLAESNIGAEEARVLQAVRTGEEIPTAEMEKLSAPIFQAIDELGAEAVSLGLVSPESYVRNRGTYLHRVYLKHEGDQPALSRWFTSFMTQRRKKIQGDALKGRGMFLEVPVDRAMADVSEFREGRRGAPVKGEKFVVLDRYADQGALEGIEPAAPKIERRIYWPAEKAIPDRYRDFAEQGTWEVRAAGKNRITLWRDFTKAERTRMGEILDARYTIGKTFMLMAQDLSTGRFYRDIAANHAWTRTATPNGKWVNATEFRRLWQDESVEWVKVPDADIPNTGGKKRWGALAGKYVRAEIWRDLNEADILSRPNLWTQLLTQWKVNKALALDTPIPTPDGWTTMGEVKVGDRVFDEKGEVCTVLEVRDVQHGRPCYEVAFSDGTRIIADDEHWWFTTTPLDRRNGSKGAVRTTSEIRSTLTYGARRDSRHSIAVAAPLNLPERDLPIAPYALGAWLGDGFSHSAQMCAGHRDVEEIVAHLDAAGVKCTPPKANPSDVFLFTLQNGSERRRDCLQARLRDLGVICNKHIPPAYLRGSETQRLELLRGLMDTDGWVDSNGACGLSTSIPQLRDDALELIRSLGHKPTVSVAQAALRGKACKPSWRIHFKANSDQPPVFKLARKAERVRAAATRRSRSGVRYIVSVEPVPSVPVRCIAVSSDSRLYLAGDGMVPTHNTARSPVVHTNNILSNMVFMDLADVRLRDLVSGIHAYVNGTADFREAEANGAFGADIISQEIRREVLQPILDDLQKQVSGGGNPVTAKLGALGKVAEAIWGATKAADRKMVNLYRIEDEVFRMAMYMRRRGLGDNPENAALEARDQFLDYDIRAPWVNAARRSVLPFIAYTYRAVPVIARSIATRPWKLAKYFMVAYAANALAYMVAPGDEDEERRSMREEERGYAWIGVPRMQRMPYRDAHGNPVFLDIRRWIPAGDVFDTNQGSAAFAIPAPIQFGGPLMMAAELMLNKAAFTGEPIVNEMTDTRADKAGKIADWAWKSWMPSAAWIPGSWYWRKIGLALDGATDPQGRPYPLPEAAASSFGVKLKPQDVEENERWRAWEFDRARQALRAEERRLARQRDRNMISEEYFEEALDSLDVKRRALEKREEDVFPPRR